MHQQHFGEHVKTMQNRWEGAMLQENIDSVLVHAGTPIVSFEDDYVYDFRPNPHFLAWLPLTHHADSVLLIRHGERPLLWFYQPEDYWHSAPADPDPWWADHFDIHIVTEPNTWKVELASLSLGRHQAALGDAPGLAGTVSPENINPSALLTRLNLERTRKTPYEIECMAAASRLAAQAHRAAETAFRNGKSEYEIHLDYLAACQLTDAELPYHSIVALNDHAAVLHYQERRRTPPEENLSFLIDAGCTVNAYASDVTRTYAARPGEFAELVNAMEAMQLELVAAVHAGLDYRDLHVRTHFEIARILHQAEIIKIPAEDAVACGLSRVFYPHGLGHFIGLQTHDVAGLIDNEGEERPRPEGHPFLRLTRDLEPGNVLTIEPGLYFIDSLLRDWKTDGDAKLIDWKRVKQLSPYGGIRIEDNVVVTENGNRNLTREAFAA